MAFPIPTIVTYTNPERLQRLADIFGIQVFSIFALHFYFYTFLFFLCKLYLVFIVSFISSSAVLIVFSFLVKHFTEFPILYATFSPSYPLLCFFVKIRIRGGRCRFAHAVTSGGRRRNYKRLLSCTCCSCGYSLLLCQNLFPSEINCNRPMHNACIPSYHLGGGAW